CSPAAERRRSGSTPVCHAATRLSCRYRRCRPACSAYRTDRRSSARRSPRYSRERCRPSRTWPAITRRKPRVSSTQIVGDAQHFVRGLDRLRIRLISALRNDQVHELVDELHVRCFEKALRESTEPLLARLARNRLARFFGRKIEVVAERPQ